MGTYPEITLEILVDIVHDACTLCPALKAVGIVGSFARGDFSSKSDIDIVVDVEKSELDFVLETFGGYVQKILDTQFNRRVDIIRYGLVKQRAVVEPERWYYYDQAGYKMMLRDLRWIYERQGNLSQVNKVQGKNE